MADEQHDPGHIMPDADWERVQAEVQRLADEHDHYKPLPADDE